MSSNDQDRRRFIRNAAAAVTGLELAMLGFTDRSSDARGKGSNGPLSALRGATAWLNSPPLTEAGLRGKVVLIDVRTYTCINWLRTLPYVRAWAKKYRDDGLVVIGVHTPEFDFEHDLDNVRRETRKSAIDHPVAIDNDYAVWRGLDNHYWPARYLFDPSGGLRHQKFGEGDYEATEKILQRLLAESGRRGAPGSAISAEGRGLEAAADWRNLETPETYLGHARAERFAGPGRLAADARRDYTVPDRLQRNRWALGGAWTVGRQAAVLGAPNGRIAFRFHARDLHIVMGPAARGGPVPFRVRIDGEPPGPAHGEDIDVRGDGVANEQRLYQLIRQPQPIVDRQFEIEFPEPGAAAFAFTFG
jgi:hypothetical protein